MRKGHSTSLKQMMNARGASGGSSAPALVSSKPVEEKAAFPQPKAMDADQPPKKPILKRLYGGKDELNAKKDGMSFEEVAEHIKKVHGLDMIHADLPTGDAPVAEEKKEGFEAEKKAPVEERSSVGLKDLLFVAAAAGIVLYPDVQAGLKKRTGDQGYSFKQMGLSLVIFIVIFGLLKLMATFGLL